MTGRRLRIVVPTLVLATALAGLGALADRWHARWLVAEVRAEVAADAGLYAGVLSAAVDRRFALLQGLAAFVRTHPTRAFLDEDFDSFAESLCGGVRGIRNFTVGPGGVMDYVYPLEGNVRGSDLVHDERPDVRADVARALRTRRITVSGPYELRQGGLGLVARLALYQGDRFWGLVAMALDVPALLEEARLSPPGKELSMSVRAASGRVFFGPPEVFGQEPVVHRVPLPEGLWELAALPRGGWAAAVTPDLWRFRGAWGLTSVLLTALTAVLLGREAALSRAVNEATEALSGSMRDLEGEVLERRKAEEEVLRLNRELEERVVQRTAELEASNRELASFSYSVSHDLRSPLRAVSGFAQSVLVDADQRLGAEERSDLGRIVEAARRMDELIDGLLRLSRIGRSDLRAEDVDLSSLAAVVAQALRRAEPGRRVEVRIAPGLVGRGDPSLLRTVLENLLGNAWKFTSRREVARIGVGRVEADGRVAFFVRDNGAGFDPAHTGQLFGPFQRLHGVAEFEGHGVGLATVQRIVRRHGGRVWAEGAVDRGATFFFTLGPSCPAPCAPSSIP